MNLLQAAEEDRRGMTYVWLRRQPSLREFVSGIDEPEGWRDRPVSGLPGAYAGAASVLMEKMISLAPEAQDRASALLPPYLFLRRHHFEMQLKSILRTVADNSSRWSTVTGQNVAPGLFDVVSRMHSLLRLWERVQPIAETALANETHVRQPPDVTPTEISELIEQLDDIDPRGDGVRYARDNRGNLTMLGVSRVDLEHTERKMLDITEFLWWVRVEVGYMVINHSDYILTSVDNQGLKEADVILQAYLDEELAAGRSMALR
jgi:hypothetical protein